MIDFTLSNESIMVHRFLENINNSSWKERITVFNLSFQDFAAKTRKKYNLIICNPPFFSNSLKSMTDSRTLARHDDELKIKDLFTISSKLIRKGGIISLILPYEKLEECINLAGKCSLFPVRLAEVKPTPNKEPARVLIQFSNESSKLKREIFTVEEGKRHRYSKRYLELTADFYLEK
jgi:tRNA1Val (adenine37-N6)-methyltransferase